MTGGEQFLLALVAWRENRHGQAPGMTSVMNVVLNATRRWNRTVYGEITHPLRYSSMTAHGDPQLGLYGSPTDPEWLMAQGLAAQAAAGTLSDITGGATNYYALGIAEPGWAKEMEQTAIIAGQRFLK